MKRWKMLVASLCLAMVISFSACQSLSSTDGESQSSSQEESVKKSSSEAESEEESTEENKTKSEEESTKENETKSEEESTKENEAESEEESTTEESESSSERETKEEIVFEDVNYSAVAIKNVRIRTTPEILEDNVYAQLNAGSGCTVIGYHEEWCKISYNDMVMYISTEYLVEGEPVSEPVTTVYPNGTTNTLPVVTANGKKVAIDAGHQISGISEKEPNAPGSTLMKAKLTSGTQGSTTGLAEYVLNLQVSMYLKEELLNRGYEVFMIRENHNCPLSNAERAVEANNSGSDIFVRIHANSSDNTSVNGGLTMVPSSSNPYVGAMAAACMELGTLVSNHMNAASGFKNMGVQTTDTMTGINWCSIPVTIVEMGFMSNPDDDTKMSQESVQRAIAKGIADGIDAYFAAE